MKRLLMAALLIATLMALAGCGCLDPDVPCLPCL
ncbi:YgdI/YgdR family lipoprotein [Desulfuromonas versatilis]|nr:YgdI/YgdR family lipoprotein [Desulfuromonas versatilis]